MYVASAALAFSLILSVPALGNEELVSIDVMMTKLEGFPFASLIVKNNTDTIQRVETIRVRYECASGKVDEVPHTLRISLAPREEYKSGGTIVCSEGEEVANYQLLSGGYGGEGVGGATVISGGNQVLYYLPCGDGRTVQLTLQWDDQKEIFIYNADNSTKGVLNEAVLDDGTFGEHVCAPSPEPLAPQIIDLKNYFASELMKYTNKDQEEAQPLLMYPGQTAPMGIRAGVPSMEPPTNQVEKNNNQ
jgi:hypothetical protein